jgi:hypothetical protein
MKKIRLFGLSLFFAAVTLTGCNTQDSTDCCPFDIKDCEAMRQTVSALDTKGERVISFVVRGAWTSKITEALPPDGRITDKTAEWINLEPDHGNKAGSYTVTVKLAPNSGNEDRMAHVVFTCSGREVWSVVTQTGQHESN